jgi:acyl-CoA reductase-like NAD-dependent aldehyde dehydrogenase
VRRAWKDLRRNAFEADLMDVAYNVKEADYALNHLDNWMKPERVQTPLVFEPGHVRVCHDPFGVTLIIGAWNEPFMLLFAPLVAAFAGGNVAVLKPSELAATCSAATAKLVPKYFDPQVAAVVEGAVPETTALLNQKMGLHFLHRQPPGRQDVHQAAAKNLTPCVLELGGKNPTIVHSSANLAVAARRIANGRYFNSGHICTAPDHVLVWPEIKEAFVRQMADAIREFYGDYPKLSPDYGINRRNFDRLLGCSVAARWQSRTHRCRRAMPTNYSISSAMLRPSSRITHLRAAATSVNPCTGARGATSHGTSLAADLPGCRSAPGAQNTGIRGRLPAGQPGPAT